MNWFGAESEIAQPPPIAMPSAKIHEPPAKRIKKQDNNEPCAVDEGKSMAISNGALRMIRNDGADPHGLMKYQCGANGDEVNDIEMKDVVEHRHASKHRQHSAHAAFRLCPVE